MIVEPTVVGNGPYHPAVRLYCQGGPTEGELYILATPSKCPDDSASAAYKTTQQIEAYIRSTLLEQGFHRTEEEQP